LLLTHGPNVENEKLGCGRWKALDWALVSPAALSLASPLYKRSSTREDARVEPGSLTREAMVASAIPQAANKAVRLCACLQLVAFSFPIRPHLVVL